MSKKTSAIVLSSLIVMNQVSEIPIIHANNSISSAVNQEQADKQSKQVIYVTNGEGNLNAGDGTSQKPYQNIRTALKQVEDGGTIKIVGTVEYAKHEVEPNTQAALPLTIEKNITIEGASGDTTNDTLSTRAPIQLGANVTFKNMRIEMPNLNQIMPGVQEPAPTPADEGIYKSGRTIYVAGHTLTLDNVNTRLGSHIDQVEERPFISGGSFWAEKATGDKSVVNIVNPNSETRFNSIYAGDYWKSSSIPFELNLGEKINNKTIIDNTIHTGGIMNDYSGDVKITIGGSVSPTFDYTKHTGNTDVEINYSKYLGNIEFNGLRTLTLSNQAYVEVKKDSNFDVENLVVKDGSLLDLEGINGNPIVNGDFTGDDTSSIYLDYDQTLKVNGLANGAIRLNHHITKPPYTFTHEDHVYLSANKNSTLELIICDEDIEYGLRVWETVNNGIKEYSLVMATPLTGNVTITGTPKVGQTLTADTTNCQDNAKLTYQWFIDGNEIVGANQPTFTLTSDHVGHSISVKVTATNYTGTLSSQAVTVLENELTGDVTIVGTPKVGQTLIAETSNCPEDANLTYQWFANGTEIKGATQSTLDLTEDYVGQSITVKVSSNNYTETIESNSVTVVTNKLTGTVTVDGTPRVGETLTANTKGLQTDATGITYKWYVDGKLIEGKTSSTLLLKQEYAGKNVTAEVVAENYEGALSSSSVTVLKIQLTGNVTISGTPQVGQILTATPENLPDTAIKLRYQWYVDGVAIEGATQSTLEVKSEYSNKKITVIIATDTYLGKISSSEVTIQPEETLEPEQPGAPEQPITFSDIEQGKWYTPHIQEFAGLGYINGYSDGTFKPHNSITRAEFVKIVNKAFGLANKYEPIDDLPFTDLDKQWKKEELKLALAAGYITPAVEFRHNDPINRQEAAKIIGYLLGDKLTDNSDWVFTDSDEIAIWAKDYIAGLVQSGVISKNEKFRPKDSITRAEAVKMLNITRGL